MIENEQKNDGIRHHDREEAETPRERNALHESHQKRRVADRGETSSDVGNQEDEEDHDMMPAGAPGVHLDDRTDHQHAGSGCADKTGQQRSDQKQKNVNARRAREIAFKADISGYAEQAEQKNDKGQIIIYDTICGGLDASEYSVFCG